MMAGPRKHKRSRPGDKRAARRWVMPAVVVGLFALLAVGLGATYHVLSQPGRLPLRVIQINGEFQHLDRGAIQRVVVDAIDGGFFSCDMRKLREAVLAMPWVDDVSVRRSWPDRLSMIVTEQTPLARWGDDALVNVRGDLFSPSDLAPFSNLVGLSGPLGSERRVVAFYQRAVIGARSRGMQLREVELDQRRHWWLRFDDGLVVSLGREQVEYRLAQFLRVYPSLAAEPARQPQRVDMRYAHGFAVSWREPVVDRSPGDAGTVKEKA